MAELDICLMILIVICQLRVLIVSTTIYFLPYNQMRMLANRSSTKWRMLEPGNWICKLPEYFMLCNGSLERAYCTCIAILLLHEWCCKDVFSEKELNCWHYLLGMLFCMHFLIGPMFHFDLFLDSLEGFVSIEHLCCDILTW